MYRVKPFLGDHIQETGNMIFKDRWVLNSLYNFRMLCFDYINIHNAPEMKRMFTQAPLLQWLLHK